MINAIGIDIDLSDSDIEFSSASRLSSAGNVRAMISECRTRRVRTLQKFAEAVIRIPNDGGKFGGQPFRLSRQPFVKLLYDEIQSGRWSEIFITGPSQSGKSLCAFVIIVIYIAVELRKNVGIAMPGEDMISDKWLADFRPVFESSPELRKLLPKEGSGSRGGKVTDTIQLNNGVLLKFYTPGGSDQSKAGFTSPIVIGTEAAGFSRSTSTSKEADPLRQLRARQRSQSQFDDDGSVNTDRLMLFEGTVTVPEDLPWSMKDQSSDSRIACPCPHCKAYVTPEREHFVGYEDAADEFAAQESGWFCCPACGEQLTPEHRQRMNQSAVLLHGEQEMVDGKLVGEMPKTHTLFFRWSAFNNLFVSERDLAVQEYKLLKLQEGTAEHTNADKDLSQSVWCWPYVEPAAADMRKITESDLEHRIIGTLPPKTIPADAVKVVTGIDVGRHWCWYVVLALRSNGSMIVVDAGRRATGFSDDTQNNKSHEFTAIRDCLLGMFDEQLKRGYATENGKPRKADLVIVDGNYRPDAVIDAQRKSGYKQEKLIRSIGRGQTLYKKIGKAMSYIVPTKLGASVKRIGDGWHRSYASGKGSYYILDSDRSKIDVQTALQIVAGNPGSISLVSLEPEPLALLVKHLASEIRITRVNANGRVVHEWNKSGANHLLDCCAMGWVGHKILGFDLGEYAVPTPSDGNKQYDNQDDWLYGSISGLMQAGISPAIRNLCNSQDFQQ